MGRRQLCVVVTVLIALGLAGCSKDEPESDAEKETSKQATTDEKVRRVAKIRTAQQLVNATNDAIMLYYVTMNAYPDNQRALEALIKPPADEAEAKKWHNRGPFLQGDKIPVDPWGRPLRYKLLAGDEAANAPHPFRIWSVGPDGISGTFDDLTN
ncbi:MAG: type II secretion system protein GspG [Planctomycetota bacterium]|nr:type II secretion system protein GspG [Planctomycetota bacterium]